MFSLKLISSPLGDLEWLFRCDFCEQVVETLTFLSLSYTVNACCNWAQSSLVPLWRIPSTSEKCWLCISHALDRHFWVFPMCQALCEPRVGTGYVYAKYWLCVICSFPEIMTVEKKEREDQHLENIYRTEPTFLPTSVDSAEVSGLQFNISSISQWCLGTSSPDGMRKSFFGKLHSSSKEIVLCCLSEHFTLHWEAIKTITSSLVKVIFFLIKSFSSRMTF